MANPKYFPHQKTIGCAIPNCEQCKESSQDVKGECTKCADMFVLNNGTCNDSKLFQKALSYKNICILQIVEFPNAFSVIRSIRSVYCVRKVMVKTMDGVLVGI